MTKVHGAAANSQRLKNIKEEARLLADSHIALHGQMTTLVRELSGPTIYTTLMVELTNSHTHPIVK